MVVFSVVVFPLPLFVHLWVDKGVSRLVLDDRGGERKKETTRSISNDMGFLLTCRARGSENYRKDRHGSKSLEDVVQRDYQYGYSPSPSYSQVINSIKYIFSSF